MLLNVIINQITTDSYRMGITQQHHDMLQVILTAHSATAHP